MFGLFKSKERKQLELVQELVSSYGAALEAQDGSVKNSVLLPAGKDEIGNALLVTIDVTPAGAMRDHLIKGYLWLAEFQDLTAEEMANVKIYDMALAVDGEESAEATKGRALAIAETGEVVSKLQEIVMAEMAERRNTLIEKGLVES